MRQRLLPDHKIRHKREFDAVFKKRNRLYGKYFLAYYRLNEVGHARMGTITSKHNVRKAVRRNRIRRVLKEQFRLSLSHLPNVDIVFIAKKEQGNADNEELRQCQNRLLQQAIRLVKKQQ